MDIAWKEVGGDLAAVRVTLGVVVGLVTLPAVDRTFPLEGVLGTRDDGFVLVGEEGA